MKKRTGTIASVVMMNVAALLMTSCGWFCCDPCCECPAPRCCQPQCCPRPTCCPQPCYCGDQPIDYCTPGWYLYFDPSD